MKHLGLKKTAYAILLHLVFYVMPAKYFKMYIYLTVISLLRKIRQASVDIAKINETHFIKDMQVSINQDAMLFPEYSFNLIWQDELLDQLIMVGGNATKIRTVLGSPTLTVEALDTLVNRIYSYLPYYDRMKLVGFNKKNECSVKSDLREVLLFNR